MSKWFAALQHIILAVVAVLGAALASPRELSVWAQVAVVGLAAVVTYAVPLVNAKWRASLKVILGSMLPAVIVAALPFLPIVGHGFNPQNAFPLIIAILTAVGTQIGVDMRATARTSPVVASPPLATGEDNTI